MGKKKNKNRKKLNRKQFLNIVCKNCGLCDGMAEAAFCFDFLYKKSPLKFGSVIAPKLMRLSGVWPADRQESTQTFERIFCDSDTCGFRKNENIPHCQMLSVCLNAFRDQKDFSIAGKNLSLKAFKKALNKSSRIMKNGAKAKKKFIARPYPTFFFNGKDPEWFAEIRSVLNGDNDCEQNKGEKNAGADEAADRSGASNSEP